METKQTNRKIRRQPVRDFFAHAPLTTERMPQPEDFRTQGEIWAEMLWRGEPW